MPPKKDKKNIASKKKVDGKIINMYERIPKHFLEKLENPNFPIHKLKRSIYIFTSVKSRRFFCPGVS